MRYLTEEFTRHRRPHQGPPGRFRRHRDSPLRALGPGRPRLPVRRETGDRVAGGGGPDRAGPRQTAAPGGPGGPEGRPGRHAAMDEPGARQRRPGRAAAPGGDQDPQGGAAPEQTEDRASGGEPVRDSHPRLPGPGPRRRPRPCWRSWPRKACRTGSTGSGSAGGATITCLGRALVLGQYDEFCDRFLGRPAEGDSPRLAAARRAYDAGNLSEAQKLFIGCADQLRVLMTLARTGNPEAAARALPKQLARLLIGALQSEIFNAVLERRLRTSTRSRPATWPICTAAGRSSASRTSRPRRRGRRGSRSAPQDRSWPTG